ncbi:MAG TPA: glycosyltransferase family 2 protein [Kamptonema sp.]|nr:glycosyltransferase family 2 protein [Kamptonema sp.]
MSNNLFSIVIPTRQRHDTLKYSIQSVLNQTYKEFELIVMDNFSSSETAEVVSSFGDERIKYYRAPERLSMSDNWEMGLSYATGKYVTILGDDDGLMPDGLELSLKLITEYDVQIVSWSRGTAYWWPNAIVPWHRNKLYVELSQGAVIYKSREQIKQFYKNYISYVQLPMLYNSFVYREIIEKIKSVHGRYFMSPIPDVYSGVVNAYFSESYLFGLRPISINGVSGHSTGTSSVYSSLDNKPFNDFLKDAKKDTSNFLHKSLIPSTNTCMHIADVQLRTKELFFPEDEELQFDILNTLKLIAINLNKDPGSYDNQVQELEQLAKKHGILISQINIPEKETNKKTSLQGLLRHTDESYILAINGNQAGMSNVAEAAKITQAVLPNLDCITVNCLKKEDAIALYNKLNLRETNLIIFPEWNYPEDSLGEDLMRVIKALATHPERKHITLLVDTSRVSNEDANLLISGVIINLLMSEKLEVSDELEISLTGQLNKLEWEYLLSQVQGRIVLQHEDKEAIAHLGAENLPLHALDR